ncbi:MAG: 4Fe-4S binding protein [Bacteroides sp.]|nr:4Fe-4S binding protein [Bacteroides sp.]
MIFFFSGTGNSRYLAQQLGKSLGDEVREMTFFTRPTGETIQDSRVVWVFPVHSWGIPKFVLDFISTVNVEAGARHFMVCSCGDDIGLTHVQWRSLMESRGWTAVAAYSVIMPNTYVLLPGFDIDSPEVAERKLEAAASRIRDVATRIHLNWEGEEVKPGSMAAIKSKVIYPFFEKFMLSPRPFGYNKSRCYGCGKCAAHCPMGNILLDNLRRPEWGTNCTMCLACYHSCPVHAVNYGSRTKNKGQYLCPLR